MILQAAVDAFLRRSQLTGDWLAAKEGDGWKLTVEQDWAGSRRALATSCGSKLPKDRTRSVQGASAPKTQRVLNHLAG